MRGVTLLSIAVVLVSSACATSPAPSVSELPSRWGPLAVKNGGHNGDKARTEGVLEITDKCAFLIRWKPYLAYDTAPWIGRVVAVCFVAIWITSGYAFFTNSL